jgi:hypothetical protein
MRADADSCFPETRHGPARAGDQRLGTSGSA